MTLDFGTMYAQAVRTAAGDISTKLVTAETAEVVATLDYRASTGDWSFARAGATPSSLDASIEPTMDVAAQTVFNLYSVASPADGSSAYSCGACTTWGHRGYWRMTCDCQRGCAYCAKYTCWGC
jgi:hypothetical protein